MLLASNILMIVLDRGPHFQRIKAKEGCHNRHNDDGARENEAKDASNFSERETLATV